MGDDGDDEQTPDSRRVTNAGRRSIELIVDRRIQAILDRRLRQFEQKLGEQIDGRPGTSGEGAGSAVLADLVEDVARLNDVMDRLVAAHDKAPPPFHWDDLEPEERDERWTEFTGWVDTVLRPWLPRQSAALKTCWEEHPGVVYLITALWFAWSAAFRGTSRKGPEPLAWMKDLRGLADDLTAEMGAPNMPCKAHPTTLRPRPQGDPAA